MDWIETATVVSELLDFSKVEICIGGKATGETNRKKLLRILEDRAWVDDLTLRESLKPLLVSLCYFYLVEEKYAKKQALNRVANFHLRNGALLENINWLGNTSAKGLNESAGIMVSNNSEMRLLLTDL